MHLPTLVRSFTAEYASLYIPKNRLDEENVVHLMPENDTWNERRGQFNKGHEIAI
jgi:hypothetical protein